VEERRRGRKKDRERWREKDRRGREKKREKEREKERERERERERMRERDRDRGIDVTTGYAYFQEALKNFFVKKLYFKLDIDGAKCVKFYKLIERIGSSALCKKTYRRHGI